MILLFNSFIFSLASFSVSSRIFKININYRRKNYWVVVILNSLLITLTFIASDHFLRVVFNFLILTTLNKKYFKTRLIDTMIGSFFVFALIIISELILVFLLISILKVDPIILTQKYKGQLWINIYISVFLVTIINIHKIRLFFYTLSDNVKAKTIKKMLPIIIFLIFIYSAFNYYLYFRIDLMTALLMSIILIVIITVLVMNVLKEKSYNVNLKKEYDELINNLNEYEKILEKYRLTNHENKNNFIILKGMLEGAKKNVVNYIDEIINSKQTDDEEILFKTKKLPTGGLQGLIYQKMLIMKEKGILYNLEISRNLSLSRFKDLDFELNKNICTIVGILIDNAIEAVAELENKKIGLYFYFEDGLLNISISNTFLGAIDLDKMDNIGYSSKGKGRGYGLSLAKKIIDKDIRIKLQREIIKNIFKQKLKIKM